MEGGVGGQGVCCLINRQEVTVVFLDLLHDLMLILGWDRVVESGKIADKKQGRVCCAGVG